MSRLGGCRIALGAVVVLTLLAAAWYAAYRYKTFPFTAPDGDFVTLPCAAGASARVVSARYAPAGGGPSADVAAPLQKALGALGGNATYVVSGAALGQGPGGALTARLRCAAAPPKVPGARAGFRPVPVSACGTLYDDHYAVDMGNRTGTVVWDPYSSISRISLERSAETPEVATPPNPITGAGLGTAVRAMGDRYRRNAALQRLTSYELQPGEPGVMELVDRDGMRVRPEEGPGGWTPEAGWPYWTGGLTASTGAAPYMATSDVVMPRGPPGRRSAPCNVSLCDVDADYVTDGPFGPEVVRETLTSRRVAPPNELTGNRVGLGSVRIDPRFDPGPRCCVATGDNNPAPGGYAGGPSFGALASRKFLTSAQWDAGYVHGFGDRDCDGYAGPEAAVTGVSQWGPQN